MTYVKSKVTFAHCVVVYVKLCQAYSRDAMAAASDTTHAASTKPVTTPYMKFEEAVRGGRDDDARWRR